MFSITLRLGLLLTYQLYLGVQLDAQLAPGGFLYILNQIITSAALALYVLL